MTDDATEFPITKGQVRAILADIGYDFASESADRINFTLRPNIAGETRRRKLNTLDAAVTMNPPDKRNPAHAEKVYDRSYVIHLLKTILGDGAAEAGKRIDAHVQHGGAEGVQTAH